MMPGSQIARGSICEATRRDPRTRASGMLPLARPSDRSTFPTFLPVRPSLSGMLPDGATARPSLSGMLPLARHHGPRSTRSPYFPILERGASPGSGTKLRRCPGLSRSRLTRHARLSQRRDPAQNPSWWILRPGSPSRSMALFGPSPIP